MKISCKMCGFIKSYEEYFKTFLDYLISFDVGKFHLTPQQNKIRKVRE